MSPEPDKIRIRSEEELQNQAAGLDRLARCLEELGVKYYLSGGTLLGAARDGDFIRWDWDVEVSVRSEEARPMIGMIVQGLEGARFRTRGVDESMGNLKVVAERDGAVFEIRGYRRRGDLRERRDFRTKDHFFRETSFIELRGRRYPCLGPLDDYLTDRYGDWRTPVRSATKSDYLAPNYFVRSAAARRFSVVISALGRRVIRTLSR